jgi:hypothetical protein
MLGLKKKSGPLKDAYDKIIEEDRQDKEIDFKYSEQALKEAENEQITIKQPLPALAALPAQKIEISNHPKGLSPIDENLDEDKSAVDKGSFLE